MARFIILFTLFYISSSESIAAQATATFTASVTIIEPIEISTLAQMNFAHVDAGTGGQVILTPENERISSDGVKLDNAVGVSAAAFEIRGRESYAFSISLPEDQYILTNGREDIIIRDFTSSLAENSRLNASGKQILHVGATLRVNEGQMPGFYTSSQPLNVTVNYN